MLPSSGSTVISCQLFCLWFLVRLGLLWGLGTDWPEKARVEECGLVGGPGRGAIGSTLLEEWLEAIKGRLTGLEMRGLGRWRGLEMRGLGRVAPGQ